MFYDESMMMDLCFMILNVTICILFSANAFKAGKIQSNPFAHGSAAAEAAITGHATKASGAAIPPPSNLGNVT